MKTELKLSGQKSLSFLILISIMFTLSSCETIEEKNDRLVLVEEFIYKEAPFPSCHASTIEETPGGLIAAWFGGTRESHEDVEIWTSRKVDGSWTTPVSVADGVQQNRVLQYRIVHLVNLPAPGRSKLM